MSVFLQFTLAREELARALKVMGGGKFRIRFSSNPDKGQVVRALVYVAIAVLVFTWAWSPELSEAISQVRRTLISIGSAFLLMMLFAWIAWRSMIRKNLDRTLGTIGTQTVCFAEDGVTSETAQGPESWSWTDLSAFTRVESLMVFWLPGGKALIVPRRAFRSEADINEVLTLLSHKGIPEK